MDFSKMLKQAQEMQQKMMEAKDGLKNVIAEGVSGGSAVKVQMNGHFEVVKIDISDEILKEQKGVFSSERLRLANQRTDREQPVQYSWVKARSKAKYGS